MNIRQIEAFRAIMETGSVTRAAEALRISQPAASKLLRAFEERCGFGLFERMGGRLVPTPEARQLAIEVDRVFSGAERIAAAAQAIRERRLGQVAIAAFPALALRFLPRVLTPLLMERQDLQLSLQSRTSPRVVDLVVAQQVDFGLSLLPVDHPFVACEELVCFDMVCAVPVGHRLARHKVIRPADLRDVPFISLGHEDRSRFVIDEALRGRGLRRRIQIEAQLAESACAFVANGLGVAIVPTYTAADFGDGRLIAKPFRPAIQMSVWLLLPKASPPSQLTQDILGRIREALSAFAADK